MPQEENYSLVLYVKKSHAFQVLFMNLQEKKRE